MPLIRRRRSPPVAGLVLAGGFARRLGREKRGIRVQGVSLLARTCRLLRGCVPEVYIAAEPGFPFLRLHGCDVLHDPHPGWGPMLPIVEALQRLPASGVLAVPVDMPFLTREFLAAIRDAGESWDAVVVEWDGRLRPLPGFYSKALAASMARALRRGRRSLTRWLEERDGLRMLCIQPEARMGPPERLMFNVNTPADLEALADDLEKIERPGSRFG